MNQWLSLRLFILTYVNCTPVNVLGTFSKSKDILMICSCFLVNWTSSSGKSPHEASVCVVMWMFLQEPHSLYILILWSTLSEWKWTLSGHSPERTFSFSVSIDFQIIKSNKKVAVGFTSVKGSEMLMRTMERLNQSVQKQAMVHHVHADYQILICTNPIYHHLVCSLPGLGDSSTHPNNF